MKKKSLAVITARGGSKRIPRKNIRDFCGKPIITYSIEAALKSEIFDEIMVSTDDEKIKDIAVEYGAKVPFMRSEKTSNDYAATHEVLLEVLDEYKKRDIYFENICCIYPTAPFVTQYRLKEAYVLLEKQNADSVVTVTAFSFPPQRALLYKDSFLKYQYPENQLVRSQDLEKIYHDAGQFYFMKTDRFLDEKKLVMKKTAPIILDDLEVQDIDNETDWLLAEMKYRLICEKE